MSGYVFREFPWSPAEPEVRRERLCEDAGLFGEKVRISCRLEGESFAAGDEPVRVELVVVAYNVERGYCATEQIEQFLSDPGMAAADVLLLSETDRGCSRTEWRSVTREYARALRMNYVFGVEFVELPRRWGAGRRIESRCEHGNAVLSRYPLGNARLIRFERNRGWHSWLQRLSGIGEPRLGGRMALAADVQVGDGILHVYSVHLESGRRSGECRRVQAEELAEDATGRPFGAVVGGDMNCPPGTDVMRAFTDGFVDAHADLPSEARATTRSGAAIDMILGRRVRFTAAGIGRPERWDKLSDHRPVWARLKLG